jgi:hypothetical protein
LKPLRIKIKGKKMKWLEIITIRTAGISERKKALRFLEQMEPAKATEEPLDISVYENAILETDFSIHIHWSAETLHQGKSSLGLQLVQALRDVGLTNHTLWVECRLGSR